MPARTTKNSRTISVALDKDLFDLTNNYMISESCANMSEAVRQLIRIGLSSDPALGAIQAVKIRAFNEVRTWSLKELAKHLTEMSRLLSETVTSAEKL